MGKMMRILVVFVVMIICLGGSQTTLWAASTLTATPVTYQVTIHQIRMYNQDDDTWYVAGTGDLAFDIASAGAGTAVGNYISDCCLVAGTYTQVEVTMSRTFGIKAVVFDNPGDLGGGSLRYYYTTTGTASGAIVCITDLTLPPPPLPFPPPPVGYALGTAVIPPGAILPATETIKGDYLIHTEALNPNIIIRVGESRTIRVSFDITGAATFDGAAYPPVLCYPSPPVITITQIE